jgi:hypothetical protein
MDDFVGGLDEEVEAHLAVEGATDLPLWCVLSGPSWGWSLGDMRMEIVIANSENFLQLYEA